MKNLRSRKFLPEDFARFDLIIAMDQKNQSDIEMLRPDATTPLRLLTDFAPKPGADHIPDPYYTRDFDGVFDLIELCLKGMAAQLH